MLKIVINVVIIVEEIVAEKVNFNKFFVKKLHWMNLMSNKRRSCKLNFCLLASTENNLCN